MINLRKYRTKETMRLPSIVSRNFKSNKILYIRICLINDVNCFYANVIWKNKL